MCGAGGPGEGERVIVTVHYLRPTRRGLSKHPNSCELVRGGSTLALLSPRVPYVLQLKCGVHCFRLSICSVALQPSLAVHILASSKCEEDKGVCLYGYESLSDGDTFREMRRCANVYLHKPRQYSIAYYTSRLYSIA